MTHTERAEQQYGMAVAEMPPLTRRFLRELDAAAGPREEFVAAMTGLASEALGREWDEISPLADHAAEQHLRGLGAHAVQRAAIARFVEGFGGLLAAWCGTDREAVWEWARWASAYLHPEPERDDRPVEQTPNPGGWLAP